MVLMGILTGECLSNSGGRKSVGLTERMKDRLGIIQTLWGRRRSRTKERDEGERQTYAGAEEKLTVVQ